MLPAAAFMDKRDHPVHLWKIAQSLGSTEVVGNGAHRGGGAVHCGDDGYIVPGAHTSVGTAISLKQASLRLLHVVHKAGALSTKFERRLQGGLATSFSFSKPQIMGMNQSPGAISFVANPIICPYLRKGSPTRWPLTASLCPAGMSSFNRKVCDPCTIGVPFSSDLRATATSSSSRKRRATSCSLWASRRCVKAISCYVLLLYYSLEPQRLPAVAGR